MAIYYLRNTVVETSPDLVLALNTVQGGLPAIWTSPNTQVTDPDWEPAPVIWRIPVGTDLADGTGPFDVSVEVAAITNVDYRFRIHRYNSGGVSQNLSNWFELSPGSDGPKTASMSFTTAATWAAGDMLGLRFEYRRTINKMGNASVGISVQDLDSRIIATLAGGPTTIAAIPGDATADAPVPIVAAGATATITSVAADATADAPTPTVTAERAVTVTAVVASATADAPAPTVAAGGAATITAVAAAATADFPAPLVEVEQIARPVSDANIGGWTTDTGATTNLFQAIDEPAPASDTDYIQSPIDPTAAVYVCQLGGLGDPARSDGHQFRYRYRKDGTATIDLTVELRQSYTSEGAPGTLIADWTHAAIGDTEVTAMQTLTGGEADLITNYGALAMRFVANRPA